MKTLLYFILPLTFVSCCLGIPKCPEGNNSAAFRIRNSTNGNDLVFGLTKVYNKDSIKFYSLIGSDTIYHTYNPGAYSNVPLDSLLFVSFDSRKIKIVYVKLNDIDLDTLSLNYRLSSSTCCGDRIYVSPASYNNNYLENSSDGITIIKK